MHLIFFESFSIDEDNNTITFKRLARKVISLVHKSVLDAAAVVLKIPVKKGTLQPAEATLYH